VLSEFKACEVFFPGTRGDNKEVKLLLAQYKMTVGKDFFWLFFEELMDSPVNLLFPVANIQKIGAPFTRWFISLESGLSFLSQKKRSENGNCLTNWDSHRRR
jgi:hypothetical protein